MGIIEWKLLLSGYLSASTNLTSMITRRLPREAQNSNDTYKEEIFLLFLLTKHPNLNMNLRS